MNKILIICGPTGVGKTALAVKLAKKFNGEIVSADSRQVYRGMDIITGKDLSDEIKIWLLDIAAPDEKFNVADYYKLAWQVITDIWQRGKLPIIVGGTGFYIKAVIEGLGTMGIGPDWKLRNELQGRTVLALQEILVRLDPKRARRINASEKKNPRRLVRAIEIAGSGLTLEQKRPNPKINKLFIGLTAPYKTLYERIDQRVDERVRMGAEEEVKKLLAKRYEWGNSVLGTTIGYREWQEYFQGKLSKEEVIKKWQFAEHNYARRQMTWFKKRPGIKWFDIEKGGWQEKVEKLVKSWYS